MDGWMGGWVDGWMGGWVDGSGLCCTFLVSSGKTALPPQIQPKPRGGFHPAAWWDNPCCSSVPDPVLISCRGQSLPFPHTQGSRYQLHPGDAIAGAGEKASLALPRHRGSQAQPGQSRPCQLQRHTQQTAARSGCWGWGRSLGY